MATERPKINVTIRLAGIDAQSNAQGFWSAASKPYVDEDNPEADLQGLTVSEAKEREAIFLAKFPKALHEALVSHVRERTPSQDLVRVLERLLRRRAPKRREAEEDEDVVPTELLDVTAAIAREIASQHAWSDGLLRDASYVSFKVGLPTYGSLTLPIAIGCLPRLAKVFDSDFDAFLDFLTAGVSEAFEAIVEGQMQPHVVELGDASALRSAFISASASVKETKNARARSHNAIETDRNRSDTAGPGTSLSKLQKFWQLSNFLLLVPCILSIVVAGAALLFVGDNARDLNTTSVELVKASLADKQATLATVRSSYENALQALTRAGGTPLVAPTAVAQVPAPIP